MEHGILCFDDVAIRNTPLRGYGFPRSFRLRFIVCGMLAPGKHDIAKFAALCSTLGMTVDEPDFLIFLSLRAAFGGVAIRFPPFQSVLPNKNTPTDFPLGCGIISH